MAVFIIKKGVIDIKLYSKNTSLYYKSWHETSWEEINNLEYEDYYRNSPVQGVAFVVARKM